MDRDDIVDQLRAMGFDIEPDAALAQVSSSVEESDVFTVVAELKTKDPKRVTARVCDGCGRVMIVVHEDDHTHTRYSAGDGEPGCKGSLIQLPPERLSTLLDMLLANAKAQLN